MALSDHIAFSPSPAELLHLFFSSRSYSHVAVLADANTHSHCYSKIQGALPPHQLFVLPPGEQHKTLATCERVWHFLTELEMDRHGLVVVLGGGVLGDLGGFCAATFKRGIAFVLMPTTLLAQVDASVGGKLGIDFRHLKNHIGVFQEPVSTLISPAFLNSLPERELRSGFAEVIKHGLIADKNLWNDLTAQADWRISNWLPVIRRSVEIKAAVVSQDPTEKGIRKILNFGHTIGHAVESAALEAGSPLYHGEAVAVGMICEAYLSSKKGLLPNPAMKKITHYLRSIYGKVVLPNEERILTLIQQDKKNIGKRILAALLKEIGQAVWDVEISVADVAESMDFYRKS